MDWRHPPTHPISTTPSHWLDRSPLLSKGSRAAALGKPGNVSRAGEFDASVDETLFIPELRGG